jgi:hypothetical protein
LSCHGGVAFWSPLASDELSCRGFESRGGIFIIFKNTDHLKKNLFVLDVNVNVDLSKLNKDQTLHFVELFLSHQTLLLYYFILLFLTVFRTYMHCPNGGFFIPEFIASQTWQKMKAWRQFYNSELQQRQHCKKLQH